MNLVLEPYQRLARDFFLDHDRAGGFIGLGLGKTASTLSALTADPSPKGALVIAPLRVANLTWPNEIRKWEQFRWMKVENLRDGPPSGKADISLINYESLHKLTDLSFCDTIIFDELTRAKNPRSERIKALRPLLKTHRRWGLTGTPRPNSILELFAQVRLLDDGQRLGQSFDQFKKTWLVPTDYMEYNWVPKDGAEEAIYKKIADLVITMKTSDYTDVADTVTEDIEIPLPTEARGIYAEMEKELLVTMGDSDVVAQNAANLVGKLHQIASGTVYDEKRGAVKVHSAKINALKRLLVELGKDRCIIATNYIHERERICAEVPGCADMGKFKGDVEDAWNSGKLRHLVADPRSLGHGLNLQRGGKTVIWFSPTWSRESYDQFNARVARKGQTEIPMVYRLLCSGTVDDAIVETLRERGEAQGQMMTLLTNLRQMGRTFLHAA